jgi:hypothetical protein
MMIPTNGRTNAYLCSDKLERRVNARSTRSGPVRQDISF